MEAFAVSYKPEFVFVRMREPVLAKVFSTFQPDIDLAIRRVDDGTDR